MPKAGRRRWPASSGPCTGTARSAWGCGRGWPGRHGMMATAGVPWSRKERDVETRRIGSLEVSVVGLGCNNFGGRLDREGARGVVAAALDAGVNFFDTADMYGDTPSEELLGGALGAPRDPAIVATHFRWRRHRP